MLHVDGQIYTTELIAAFRKYANAMVPLDTVQMRSELYVRTSGAALREDQRQIRIRNDKWWGHAVAQLVEALRYKPEGRGFDSRWCPWSFFIDIILPGLTQPLTETSARNASWG